MAADASAAALLCEFLEAAVHQVLHARRLYDPAVFERCRLYGIAVHRSRHPDLNLYVAESILSLKDGLERGLVHRVVLRVSDADGRAREQYVFSVQVTPGASPDAVRAEAAFRGCLLKLQFADACMQPLPEGCTFAIDAHVSDLAAAPLDAWVELDAAEGGHADGSLTTIVPIKSASVAPGLRLQLHAETP